MEWDTEFFGIRIARLHKTRVEDDELATAAAEARASGVECLYVEVSPEDVASLPPLHGLRFVEARLILARPTSEAPTPAASASLLVRPGGGSDVERVHECLAELAPWSRFAVDPGFGRPAAYRMYEAWVRRAAATPEELFAVAEQAGRLIGFVTCRAEPEPSIGLLAVAEPRRGGGCRLVAGALEWAASRGRRLLTATQVRNLNALRFYRGCGFEVDQVRYIYHWWLASNG